MDYVSTRGAALPLDFCGATLAGLATDGGLYMPARWPRLSADALRAMRSLSYAETALRVMQPFVGESLPPARFEAMVREVYDDFGHPAVTPLVQLDHRHWLLELHHGPTLAFKDIALQLLGRLFEHVLGDTGQEITILGATSGDTGSAAIHAVAGRPGMRIVMLHPWGRVSEVQRRQMTTVMAANVHNIALEGSFDDAQALVKALFNDAAFRAEMALAAVNSINWARLMAQIVYYVYAGVRLGAPDRPVSFSVPTGNFGDVFAGHIAARMGLPVERLIVATNENDIVARALGQGDYSRRAVAATATPSMDIQVSSNFERLLFDLSGGDGAATAQRMAAFEAAGRLALEPGLRAAAAGRFLGVRVEGAEMQRALARAYESSGILVDPHTAVGLAAARSPLADAIEGPIVTLATAHPAKFPDAVERATGIRPSLPRRIAHIMDRAERMTRLPADAEALKAHMRALVPARVAACAG
jgi:threonine synthase